MLTVVLGCECGAGKKGDGAGTDPVSEVEVGGDT